MNKRVGIIVGLAIGLLLGAMLVWSIWPGVWSKVGDLIDPPPVITLNGIADSHATFASLVNDQKHIKKAVIDRFPWRGDRLKIKTPYFPTIVREERTGKEQSNEGRTLTVSTGYEYSLGYGEIPPFPTVTRDVMIKWQGEEIAVPVNITVGLKKLSNVKKETKRALREMGKGGTSTREWIMRFEETYYESHRYFGGPIKDHSFWGFSYSFDYPSEDYYSDYSPGYIISLARLSGLEDLVTERAERYEEFHYSKIAWRLLEEDSSYRELLDLMEEKRVAAYSTAPLDSAMVDEFEEMR